MAGAVNAKVVDIAPTSSAALGGGLFGDVGYGSFSKKGSNLKIVIVVSLLMGAIYYLARK